MCWNFHLFFHSERPFFYAGACAPRLNFEFPGKSCTPNGPLMNMSYVFYPAYAYHMSFFCLNRHMFNSSSLTLDFSKIETSLNLEVLSERFLWTTSSIFLGGHQDMFVAQIGACSSCSFLSGCAHWSTAFSAYFISVFLMGRKLLCKIL
jgi:hypothetical protein